MNIKSETFILITQLATIDNLYQSNLNDSEKLSFLLFLLVLRKEGVINDKNSILIEVNFRNEFAKKIEMSGSAEIRELFTQYYTNIIEKVTKPYFENVFALVGSFSDKFVEDKLKNFFDSQINSYFLNMNSSEGDGLQPKELSQLLNQFVPRNEELDYYNPFAGVASLSLNLRENINYFGEEINQFNWVLGKLRMLVYDAPSEYQFVNTDSLKKPFFSTDKKFDYICFNPPFNSSFFNFKDLLPYLSLGALVPLGLSLGALAPLTLSIGALSTGILSTGVLASLGLSTGIWKKHLDKIKQSKNLSSSSNAFIVSLLFAKLKVDGKMVFIMPSNFLTSQSEIELGLRKYLVENNHVESIISLPAKILNFSSISVNIVVLSKEVNKQDSVKFVDASGFYTKEGAKKNRLNTDEIINLISNKEESEDIKLTSNSLVAQNNYNLSVYKYVFEDINFKEKDKPYLIQLKDVLKVSRGVNATEKEGNVISIKDLSENKFNIYKSFESTEKRELKKHERRLVNNDLIVSSIRSLKPTIFKEGDTPIFYSDSNIYSFVIDKPDVDPEYLVLELQKDYVKKQVDVKLKGVTVPRLSKTDFLELQVVIPPIKEQLRLKNSFFSEYLAKQQSTISDQLRDKGLDIADENSFLRHQIAGTLKNARSSFKSIRKIIENQIEPKLNGIYEFKANPKLKHNFMDYLNILERDLSSINKSVNVIGDDISLAELNVEEIDLIEFIKNYVDEIKNRGSNIFNVSLNSDETELANNQIEKITIKGDRELLRKAFDNIIMNAEKHGFKNVISNENRIDIQLIYDFQSFEAEVNFSNTGIPFPEDYMLSDFRRKGSKSGASGGDGTGGWFINEVMKLHDGRLSFTDETGPEGIGDWATTIELTFPLISLNL